MSNVLSGIGIHDSLSGENSSTWIDANGNFQLGVLKGTITGKYEPKFIGKAARERYRMEKIEELGHACEELRAQISLREKRIGLKEQEIEKLRQEEKEIPGAEGMISVAKDLADVEHKLTNIQEEVKSKEETAAKKRKELEQLRLRDYYLIHSPSPDIRISTSFMTLP